MNDCEIGLAFGHGPNFWYIAPHTIAIEMGVHYCRGLLFMHALTGCDMTSSFSSIGKKNSIGGVEVIL